MGSLVPGWDADLGVPRDLAPDNVSIEEEPEREGYFARLRSHRHTQEGVGDVVVPPSLARISSPQSFGRSSTLSASTQPKSPPHISKSSTMAHDGSHGPGHSHKYQFTDWTEELTTLRGKPSLQRKSVGAAGGGAGAHAGGDAERHGAAWWRELEVGHLNEHPDAVANGEKKIAEHSTFVPQFIPEHKLAFEDKAE